MLEPSLFLRKAKQSPVVKPPDNARNFDAVVVGAGPAGSVVALRLAREGCRVALVERSDLNEPRAGESLAPAVQPLLADLSLWNAFLDLHPAPSYGTCSVWGNEETEIHSHMAGRWGCGWHVDRLEFDRMLATSAREAGATLLCGTVVLQCASSGENWVLNLRHRTEAKSGTESFQLGAAVVIDASGRAASLGRLLGARRMVFDRLIGIGVTQRGMDISQQGYVSVESSEHGWWYAAPVPKDRMVVMLMTDSDLCVRGRLSTPTVWLEELQKTSITCARAPGVASMKDLRVWSAASQRLARNCKKARWLAVGDAALAVDPVSGSGVVRSLRSSKACAEAALAILGGKTSDALVKYENGCDLECVEFLRERAGYYRIEQRWPTADFWRRRVSKGIARLSQVPDNCGALWH